MEHALPLTIGQRCADWFVMRQRITGTIAGKILLQSSSVREILGLPPQADSEPSRPAALLKDLSNMWFSSIRSTEAMMRGSCNEGAVISALKSKSFIKDVHEVGMMARKMLVG